MTINFGEWKDCITDRPTKDGTYIVIGFNQRGQCFSSTNIFYTVAHGWNTHSGNSAHAINYSDEYHSGYRYFWTNIDSVVMENDDDPNH